MKKLIKCPWCGRDKLKPTNKDLIPPHLTYGQQRCVGIGQPANTYDLLKKIKERKE